MKKTVAIFLGILGVLVIGLTAGRADEYYQPQDYTTRAHEIYRAHEVDLSLYGGWVDKHDASLAPGLGVTYYITQNLGVGGTVAMEDYQGTAIDNLSAEAYYRFPCGGWSPYVFGGVGYSFETEEGFEYIGGGIEYRIEDMMGIFADVSWHINNDTSDCVGIRAGVRFAF